MHPTGSFNHSTPVLRQRRKGLFDLAARLGDAVGKAARRRDRA
jgi:hypothetical protein